MDEKIFVEILDNILSQYFKQPEYDPVLDQLCSHILQIKTDLLKQFLLKKIRDLPQEIQDLLHLVDTKYK